MRLLAGIIFYVLVASAIPARSGQFGPWQTIDYGSPQVNAETDGVDISGPATPASGLYFIRSADRAKTYRLLFKGTVESGSATLRLKIDDAQPAYFKAPQGETEYVIGHARRIEVLIYGDAAFSYRLQSLSLVPCPTCKITAETLSQAGQAVPGWSVDVYHQPDVERTDETLLIEANTPPAGLFLRRQLDRAKTYRLTVAGDLERGAATLRIVRGENEPEYWPLPGGESSQIVSSVDAIELLIYGDVPFSYKLRKIDIEECEKCLTDGKLKEIIRAAVPGIDQDIRSDPLHGVNRLLEWTSSVVEVGGDIEVYGAVSRALPLMTAAQIYDEIWLKDAGGSKCGGFAVFFQKVLALFDIPAFTIDTGDVGAFTHVTTVVPFKGKFYVFDPTFGGVYVNGSEYVDFESVVAGRPATFQERTMPRIAMYPTGKIAAARRVFAYLGVQPECDIKATYMKCSSVPYSVNYVRFEWSDSLRKQDISPESDLIVALVKHKILSVSATAGDKAREQFLAAMARAVQ